MKGLFKNPRMSHPITQPLRPLTDAERSELARVSHASSERLNRHQRAIALLAVEGGKPLTEAAKAAGWKAQKTVARLIRRFHERGLAALDDLPRSGHPRRYGPTERARMIQELRRSPLRKEDGTATWSLTTLRRTLREAPDGLPQVSTFTLLYTIHEAGYSWQKSRTWCETGKTLRKKDGRVEESYDEYTQEKTAVIERAYLIGEQLGLQVWCEDEAGPYQTIPQPGWSWQFENQPARQAHQYLRGETAKLLTLFRPAIGELRAQAVKQSTNAILHPWLQRELTAILKQCPPAPEAVPLGRRWQDWDIYPAADQLDRFFPPVRMLLIWDNLAGHKSHSMVQWCAEHGILLLSTPNAGSWLNMAESVQRIIKRRALQGYHTYDVEILKQWLVDAVAGWNRHPTPFIWGGKRHARRDRAYARRHRVGGSGATAAYVIPRRLRSVHYYRRAA
jgi:transposase